MEENILKITRLETDVKDLEKAAEYWHNKCQQWESIFKEVKQLTAKWGKPQ